MKQLLGRATRRQADEKHWRVFYRQTLSIHEILL